MDNITELTNELRELVSTLRAESIARSVPPEYRWVDAKTIAAIYCLEPRTVLAYACKPDFPKAARDGIQPRWNLKEISEFFRGRQSKKKAA